MLIWYNHILGVNHKRICMAKITIVPDNIEFEINNPEQDILSAGIGNNLNLPHGCKNGDCGACKCKVVSGEVKLSHYNQKTLPPEEVHQGYTLLCKAHALSDVVLNIPNLLSSFPIKTLPAKVLSIDKFGQIAILKLKLPPTQKFDFYAGQFIEIILKDKNRSYSIANSPLEHGIIELHVKHYSTGKFSELVWNELQIGQILRFRGPLGNFRLQDNNTPIIMVCTGTGFAPIKAILESMAISKSTREINLFWGNSDQDDFYLLEHLKKLSKQLNIKLNLCLSQQTKEGFNSGRVTNLLEAQFKDLSTYAMYACGNLAMIEDVYNLATTKLGLDKTKFFSDAFTPSVV